MSDLASNFEIVTRSHGSCWLHKTKPMWIVHYPLPNGSETASYQAYRPANYVYASELKERDPWTVSNVRMSLRGYTTLEAAMQAIEDREWTT